MKYILIMSCLFIFFSAPAHAMWANTVENSVACLSKEDLNDMIQFAASKDQQSFTAYIETGRCIIIRGGLKVIVVDSPGMFGNETRFVFNGVKMWTTRSGLRNYRVE